MLRVSDALDDDVKRDGKSIWLRIVSVRTRLIHPTETVAVERIEKEYEYRCTEYEYQEDRILTSKRSYWSGGGCGYLLSDSCAAARGSLKLVSTWMHEGRHSGCSPP